MSATKCDNCGYMSKEYDEGGEEPCPFCDGGKMKLLAFTAFGEVLDKVGEDFPDIFEDLVEAGLIQINQKK